MINDTTPGKAQIGSANTVQVNNGILLVDSVDVRVASRWVDKRVTYREAENTGLSVTCSHLANR